MTFKEVKVVKTEPFDYNKIGSMDIAFDEKLIPIDQIKADGFEIGVNHRPLRTGHINKIKANFSGDMVSLKVVFGSRDQCYHIIQGQHVFTAFVELIGEGKINPVDALKCDIVKHKSTGIQLDSCIADDRNLCFEYSYRVTEGQERNCVSDNINMVLELYARYQRETGKIHGVTDYIFKNQYGYQKLSKQSIKLYISKGERLHELGLLAQAQKERWVMKVIDSKIKGYKLRAQKMKEIKIKLPNGIADEFRNLGLTDAAFWVKAINEGHAFKDRVKIFMEK